MGSEGSTDARDPRSDGMNALTIPTQVAVTLLPVPVVEDNKATRELAKKEAIRVVERAVNGWLYAQG